MQPHKLCWRQHKTGTVHVCGTTHKHWAVWVCTSSHPFPFSDEWNSQSWVWLCVFICVCPEVCLCVIVYLLICFPIGCLHLFFKMRVCGLGLPATVCAWVWVCVIGTCSKAVVCFCVLVILPLCLCAGFLCAQCEWVQRVASSIRELKLKGMCGNECWGAFMSRPIVHSQPTHPLLLLPLHLCLYCPLSFSLALSHIQLLPLDRSFLNSIEKMPFRSAHSLSLFSCFVSVRRNMVEFWTEVGICCKKLHCYCILVVFLLFSLNMFFFLGLVFAFVFCSCDI